MSKKQRRIAIGAVALLLAGGLAAGVGLRVKHDNDVQAKREAEKEAAERAEKAAEQQAAADKAERQLRQLLVTDLEDQVTKDAEGSVSDGILDGPILYSQCDPEGGAIDTAATTQSFSCLAATTENAGGTIEGYRYTATVNYQDYSYQWRLGGDVLP